MEKVHALKPEFIEELYNKWKEDFSSKPHSDFLDYLSSTYDENNIKENLLPGDNGVFIDDDVIHRLNTLSRVGTKVEWDLHASKILFGGVNNSGLGIYSLDENGDKVPISTVYATDLRLWNYLCLFKLRPYTQKRWGDSKDIKRLFINTLSNEKVSRHPIMRLYWTAFLCYDKTRNDTLELLPLLWTNNDFMTQVTERSQANMRDQLQWMLEFCQQSNNYKILFEEKSEEGYTKYRKFLKLYLAEDRIYEFADTEKDYFQSILKTILEIC